MAQFLLACLEELLLWVMTHGNHRRLVCYGKFAIAYGYQARLHPGQLESDVNMTVPKAFFFPSMPALLPAEAVSIDIPQLQSFH